MDCILNKVEVDATNKVYCDKELAEANQKKSDKVAEIKKSLFSGRDRRFC